MFDLAKPVHLPVGTTIHYTETYANPAANPLVVVYYLSYAPSRVRL